MLDALLDTLQRGTRFVITTHIRPDGDAIGSQLALLRVLEALGKEVVCLNSDPPPDNLGWLPGIDRAEVFDGSLAQREWIDGADAVLVVDTNALHRLGRLGPAVEASRAKKVLIDHHTEPEAWFDVAFVRDTASSTGELVYELLAHLGALDRIDAAVATALYTAIMTDTGSFRYSSVTPHVHRIVADLLERGDLQPAPIHTSLFDARTLDGLRLLGLALETITLHYGGQLGTMVVTQRMVRDSGSGLDETEGFVNYALSVAGVRAAVIFLETDSGVKMSFRSKGDAYVNEWARAFGGGGHRNASGAYVAGRPLDDVFHDVLHAAPRFLDLPEADDAPAGPKPSAQGLSDEDAQYLSSLLARQAGG